MNALTHHRVSVGRSTFQTSYVPCISDRRSRSTNLTNLTSSLIARAFSDPPLLPATSSSSHFQQPGCALLHKRSNRSSSLFNRNARHGTITRASFSMQTATIRHHSKQQANRVLPTFLERFAASLMFLLPYSECMYRLALLFVGFCRHSSLDLLVWCRVQYNTISSATAEVGVFPTQQALQELQACQMAMNWCQVLYTHFNNVASQLLDLSQQTFASWSFSPLQQPLGQWASRTFSTPLSLWDMLCVVYMVLLAQLALNQLDASKRASKQLARQDAKKSEGRKDSGVVGSSVADSAASSVAHPANRSVANPATGSVAAAASVAEPVADLAVSSPSSSTPVRASPEPSGSTNPASEPPRSDTPPASTPAPPSLLSLLSTPPSPPSTAAPPPLSPPLLLRRPDMLVVSFTCALLLRISCVPLLGVSGVAPDLYQPAMVLLTCATAFISLAAIARLLIDRTSPLEDVMSEMVRGVLGLTIWNRTLLLMDWILMFFGPATSAAKVQLTACFVCYLLVLEKLTTVAQEFAHKAVA